MEEKLQLLGLTKTEAKLYHTLLEKGPSLPGKLSQKTGVHRRIVYDALDRLTHKGLVGYIVENGKKVYQAHHPEQLRQVIEEQEQALESILPELRQMYQLQHQKQETLFYKGKQGLKSVFNDQLQEGKEILILGASPDAGKILKYYFEQYDKERVRKRIKVKILTHDKTKFKKVPLSTIKELPRSLGPAAINIYADKVAIIHWGEMPFAILINQKDIADSYREFFKMLWK